MFDLLIGPASPTPKPRTFDHLDGSDPEEDRHFSRVARRMRSSEWWATVPAYTTPEQASGEVDERLNRGRREIARLAKLPADELALAVEMLSATNHAELKRLLAGLLP